MHGAHPDRLAFKLSRPLSLSLSPFLPRVPPFSASLVSRLRFSIFLSLLQNAVEHSLHAVFQLRHWTSRSSARTARSTRATPLFLPLFFLYFSSQKRDKDARVLPHPRKGCLLGETDTGRVTGQPSVQVSGVTEIPKLEVTVASESRGNFWLKMRLGSLPLIISLSVPAINSSASSFYYNLYAWTGVLRILI